MPRKILIVDDNSINRYLLHNTLDRDYDIIEAVNGSDALAVMRENCETLSAVLLDIVMPELNGYEVLSAMRDDPALAQIPVIMVTSSEDEASRVKALTLGANDFILKPFNPEIVKHCLKNNITLRETASTLNAIQKDKLTGLYNREAFFDKVAGMVMDREPGYYVLSSFDIDNFKLINDRFGAAEGDRILREIGQVVKEDMETLGGVGGRISADNFAVLIPFACKDMSIIRIIQQNRMAFSDKQALVFSIGRYVVTDPSLPPSALYDRAYIAKQSVKGRYDTHMAYFDGAMLDKLVQGQQIIADMDTAIAEHQFEVWFQPQCNHSTGALVGAEALVRWRHPEKGLIPPGEFIPVFEQNGFVYELDKYVWEETCRYLQKWTREGHNPLPVSVNLSRYDIFRPDLIDVLTGLIERYAIPASLLRLEITESAFAKSTHTIVTIVKQLISRGFTVEIDDFGSGYSSLNTLKTVPAQVVKLDMRFLSDEDDSGRGGNILVSIVRMTKWLGMSVIAEGVEKKEQADYLLSIGCSYIQGYLYARPMPAADYERYCQTVNKEERLLTMETVENLDNSAFWNPDSMDTLIFNSYVGAACIFEYYNQNVELLRVNRKFLEILGDGAMSVEDVLKLDWLSCLTPESLAAVREILLESSKTGDEYPYEYVFLNIPGGPPKTYLRATMRVIAMAGERMLVYCASENITAQRQAEESEREAEQRSAVAAQQLQAVLDNVNSGITAITYESGQVEYLLINNRYLKMLGYTREEYLQMPTFSPIHPADREWVASVSRKSYESGEPASVEYRALQSDGSVIWMDCSMTVTRFAGSDTPVQLAIFNDITAEKRTAQDLLDNLPCGAGLYTYADGKLSRVYLNRRYLELTGRVQESCAAAIPLAAVCPEDRSLVIRELANAIEQKRDMACDIRLLHETEGYRPFRLVGRVVPRESGKYSVYICFFPEPVSPQEKSRLELLTNSIPGGIAVYEGDPDALDKIRIVYFSDGFCRLFGYDREEYQRLAAVNPLGLVAPESVSAMYQRIRALVQDNIPMDFVYRARVNGGGPKWINVRAVMGEPNGSLLTVNAVFLDVTEQTNTLENLRISEEENRLAIQHSGNVVCRYDVATQSLRVSANVSAKLSMASVEKDVPYGQVRSGRISPDTADAYTKFYEDILHGGKSGSVVFQRKSDEGWRWIEARSSTIFNGEGAPISAVLSFADVTESYEKDAAYNKWIQSLHNMPPESYSLYRGNISANTVFEEVQGSLLYIRFRPGPLSLDAHTAEYAAQCVVEEDRERFSAFLNADALLRQYAGGERTVRLEYREILPKGGFRYLRLTVDLVQSPHSADVEAYLLFKNIDEAKRAALLTIERAETDPLTGVLNRTTFAEKVDTLIKDAGPDTQHALLMLDVDGFKLVNDAFGHSAGDQVLVDIAGILRKIVRREDLVGRLGGDEFVVFLNDTPNEQIAASKARQICDLSRKAFSTEVHVSSSVGIALCPKDGASFEALYQKADTTLYHVKGAGRDNFAFYQEDMQHSYLRLDPAVLEPTSKTLYEKKRWMLIVDDSKIDLELLTNLFQNDYKIERVQDGNSALIRLHHYGSAISVVLLDLFMPGMDGFAVLEKMQQSADTCSIPVVVVSVAGDRETSLRAIRAGAADFVTKPVDPDVLRIRVRSAISKAENERLRAQNSFLELQNSETIGYRTVAERTGTVVITHDWGKGTFLYSPTITQYLAGNYDTRPLYRILLSDFVADPQTVKNIQQLVYDVANDRNRTEGSLTVRLKIPSGAKRPFAMNVYKQTNDFDLADKIILTFQEIKTEKG